MKSFLTLSLIPLFVVSPALAADFDTLVRASIDAHVNATDYRSWKQSGLTPADVVAQSFDSPQKQADLCRALDDLSSEDLEHFHSDLLDESLPCSTHLVNRIKELARARDLEFAVSKPTRDENGTGPFILPGIEAVENPPRLKSTEVEIEFNPDPNLDPERSNTLYGTKNEGLLKRRQFVITIDDGPDGRFTPRILDTLRKSGVRANFFCEGENVRRKSRSGKKIGFELVQREAAEGHIVGSHSMTHKDLREVDFLVGKQEINRGHLQIVAAIVELAAPFFRFPFGNSTKKLNVYLQEQMFTSFKWNVDTRDWFHTNKDQVISNFRKLLANPKLDRGIILIHDIQEQTAEALPTMLQMLYDKGYETAVFVPKKTVLP